MYLSTRTATYQVIINTLKGLPRTTLDAAWGLTGLFVLYVIRSICVHLGKKYPRRGKCFYCTALKIAVYGFPPARVFFFVSVLRNAFVLVILTLAAWLYCRHRKSNSGKYPIKILLTVPAGFKHIGQPDIDSKLVKALAPELPVATIILLLEHIAISKCEVSVSS